MCRDHAVEHCPSIFKQATGAPVRQHWPDLDLKSIRKKTSQQYIRSMIVVQTDTKAPHHHSEVMFERNCFHCCVHFLVQDIGIALKSSANLRGRLSRREPLWEERATKTMVFRAEPPILPQGPPAPPFGPPSYLPPILPILT